MAISRETVQRYARLARLNFSDREADRMAGELGAILDYVEEIAALDLSETADTDNLFGVPLRQRRDEPAPSLPMEKALGNGPDVEADHFLVPKVIKR